MRENIHPVLIDYESVREDMKPGDVILFAGKGWMSRIIQWGTRSVVSHAGIISHHDEQLLPDMSGVSPHKYRRVMVTDSTQMDKRIGVFTRPLSEVIESYDGAIYWLPLSPQARKRLRVAPMQSYISRMQIAKYDLWQCARAGFNAVMGWNVGRVNESAKRVFCSEYVAFALEYGGAYDFDNPSLVTPQDLAEVPIYRQLYFQIKGDRRTIKGFAPEKTRGKRDE